MPNTPLASTRTPTSLPRSNSTNQSPTNGAPTTNGSNRPLPPLNTAIHITTPVPEEDESYASSASSLPCSAPPQPSNSNNEAPLVSDTSESQLQAPAHDFAFYEWDFRDDFEAVPESVPTPALRPCSQSITIGELGTVASPADGTPLTRASIEDLMRPSIYKSQLSRELGPLAAELHSDMFGGVTTESFASRERTRSTGATESSSMPIDESRQQASTPVQQQPSEERTRRGRRVRHYTIDVVPAPRQSLQRDVGTRQRRQDETQSRSEGQAEAPRDDEEVERAPARDVAFSDGDLALSDWLPCADMGSPMPSRSNRRSRTVDFHYDRGISAESESSTRRQRSVEGDRSGGLRKLLSRLSSSSKKKK